MKTALALCALILGSSAWGADNPPPSRQAQNFVVHDLRKPARSPFDLKPEAGQEIVRLDIDVLALSAERIKRAICRELDLSSRGWGRIHLFLTSASENEQNIRIVSTLFVDGWQYRVEIPDQLEGLKLIRGIVQVLLLEFANRGGGPKSAEIPVWLTEGVAMQLRNAMGPDLILQSVPLDSLVRSVRNLKGVDTLRETRSVLRAFSAATLEELSRPELEHLTGENLKRFQSSAQLFLVELGRLPNGRACLVNMLRETSSCWNWETAFLRSFQRYFQRMLDVEKWWTVTLIGFTGWDTTQVWAPEKCLEKLDEILQIPAQVRLTRDVLPVRTYVTPQQVIAEWEFPQQRAALEQTINQLKILRFNCPLKVVSLIDRYCISLANYLQKRTEAIAPSTSRRQTTPSWPLLVRGTIERLDELYRQRETLRRDYLAAAHNSAKP